MSTPPRARHEDIIPRPPQPQTITDFIVLVFIILVSVILLGLTFTALFAFLFTDKSVTAFIAVITELMTTIIAALVGFIAGRSASKVESGEKQ